MSEKIELKAEVHSGDGVDKETPVEESTAIDDTTTTNQRSKSVGQASQGREKKETDAGESESETTSKNDDRPRNRSKSEGGTDRKGEREEIGEDKEEGVRNEGKREGGSPPLIGTEETNKDDVIQQEPTSMAEESPKQTSSSESERVAPVCQLARAQASIQAKMRPGVWLPGARNMHMSRQIWEIKATPDECLDRLVAAVDAIPQEELMEVSKLDKNRHFAEIFAFTQNCNWLDVVEVTFHTGEETGTTRGEIVSFSSGLFPALFPLSFICNSCCFCVPFSGHGQNTRRIELIKNALQLEVTVKH